MTSEIKEGVTIRLPETELGIVEVVDGQVVLHLDRLEAAITALPLAQLAEFVAGPVDGLARIVAESKTAVMKQMEARKLKEIPLAGGAKVKMTRTASYNPLPEAIEALQDRLNAEGFKAGDHFDPLAWEETIPAKVVKKFADVRALRKALALGGVTEPEAQDEWLGRFEGKPSLKIEEAK